ncbi:MAG: hypothetical protein ACOCVV_04535 [Marinobacter sp.]
MATFEDRIRNIVNDREHGSSTLVAMILDVLRGVSCPAPDKRQVRWALAELRRIDPSMVVVHHLLENLGGDPGPDFPQQLDRYEARWSGVDRQVALHLLGARDWSHARVLTHSHSGTLLSVIRQVHRACPSLTVVQTRSEPGSEGVLQYQRLSDDDVPCQLVTDGEALAMAGTVDAAWFGVDQYNSEHFVNKRGSGALTNALLGAGKPVFILGDSRKRVRRLNYSAALFEAVPLQRGILLVTEDGVQPAAP